MTADPRSRLLPVNPRRRHCLRMAVAALLGSSLAGHGLLGCSRSEPLTIGIHDWIGYEPMFLANDMGFIRNPNVVLLPSASATETLERLHSGQVHAGALTLDEVLRARADGLPLTSVLIFNVSMGADAVLAHPGIEHPRDIAGLRVGVEESALGALVLEKLLAAGELTRSAITVVPLTIDQHLTAWHEGSVDVLVTFEPVLSTLRETGAVVILDSRQFPDTIFDVLAVRVRALSSRQQTALKDLLSGHFESLRHLQRHREDAAYRIAARLNVDIQHVNQGLRGLELPQLGANHDYLSGQDQRLVQAVVTLSEIMVRSGLLTQPDNLNALFTAAYLPQPFN